MTQSMGIDLEWVNPSQTSNVQIGIVDSKSGVIFESLINPGPVLANPYSVAVHGIDLNQVASAPAFGTVWTRAVAFLNQHDVGSLVAHNASAEARRLAVSIRAGSGQQLPLKIHCTLRWARALRKSRRPAWTAVVPPNTSLSLTSLADQFGLPTPTHNATDDARTCHALAECIMEILGVTHPADVDAALGTEPYDLSLMTGWLPHQLFDVRCLSLGQLQLAASDHHRALNRFDRTRCVELWGPAEPPTHDQLGALAANPGWSSLHVTQTIDGRPRGSELARDQIFSGLNVSTNSSTGLHDILVADVMLTLKAAGRLVYGEGYLIGPDGSAPDLICGQTPSIDGYRWWPIEVDRTGRKRQTDASDETRVRKYFDRTRIHETDEIRAFAAPDAKLSWPGLAALVRCDTAAERSRPTRAFVDVACNGPTYDLVQIAHGYIESDLFHYTSTDRRQRITEILQVHDYVSDIPASVDLNNRHLPTTPLNDVLWSTDHARERRGVVLPLARDLAVIDHLLQPAAVINDQTVEPYRWPPQRLANALDVAAELDSRIVTGRRKRGERSQIDKPATGGAVETGHSTVLATGRLGPELSDPTPAPAGTFHHHQLNFAFPRWPTADNPTIRQMSIPILIRNSADRQPGQRIWIRGVITSPDIDLTELIFTGDAINTASLWHHALITVGWWGPIP